MTYVAGIDGGQSSTIAVIGDPTGKLVGRGRSGGADEVGAGPNSTRLRDALQGALGAAMASAGIAENAVFASIVAGVSGYEGRIYGAVPVFETPRLVVMHDAPVAHAGALAGQPGVVIVGGTGSVVYGTDGSSGRTSGGWGYLFGDEGSAFWLAREALADLMRAEDDGVDALRLATQAACRFFSQPALRPLVRAVYSGEIGRDHLAAFAPVVLEHAAFTAIADRGAQRLAQLAASAIERGAAPLVACTGGLFATAAYREHVEARLRRLRPGVEIVAPRYEPAVGALLLAYREAGMTVRL